MKCSQIEMGPETLNVGGRNALIPVLDIDASPENTVSNIDRKFPIPILVFDISKA